jgi:hypothetical protein
LTTECKKNGVLANAQQWACIRPENVRGKRSPHHDPPLISVEQPVTVIYNRPFQILAIGGVRNHIPARDPHILRPAAPTTATAVATTATSTVSTSHTAHGSEQQLSLYSCLHE